MNYDRLIRQRNLKHFARYYRLILFSVVVAVMVIVGSLVIGDSVRATLRHQVEERLGRAESVIFARQSLLEEEVLQHPLLADARAYMLVEGFLSYEGRMLPVMVWGADVEQAMINEPLQEELGGMPADDIVLRLPATGMVPSGSLFVTENYTTSLRVAIAGVTSAEEGGNMNLRNEQIRPLNIFIPRQTLAQAMEREGKINLILADNLLTREQWGEVWQPRLSGLKIVGSTDFSEVTSLRIFLQEQVVESLCESKEANRLYSYLANDIATQQDTIPYSFVTAMDSYRGEPLQGNDIILSDYSARRLRAKVGDRVDISYFVAEKMKNLSTKWQQLRVKAIVPIEELEADSGLSAEFPGLSDVERCTEWDSDLPIDMERIKDEDEDYWYRYRQTPKAIIPYMLIKKDWASDYGTATALRIKGDIDTTHLTPEMFGVDILHPREGALYAANNGVDFSSLFLALGFFIVAAALMLMYAPLWEMYSERTKEFDTLSTIGYTPKRIRGLLLREALPVVLVGGVIGVCVAALYTGIILWLLEGVWHGATHTAAFHIHIRPMTVAIGSLSSVVLIIAILLHAIRRAVGCAEQAPQMTHKSGPYKKTLLWLVPATMATIGTYLYGLVAGGSVMLFVLAGLLFMVSTIGWVDMWICLRRSRSQSKNSLNQQRAFVATLYAMRAQNRLSLLILSFGVFILFVVGLNRRTFDDGQKLSGATGGYTLWCQTAVALQHDPSTEDGREELAIAKEWDTQAEVMTCLRYAADDASCLNLNKVSEPTVLGVDFDDVERGSFALGSNIYGHKGRHALMQELRRPLGENTYPAIIDATSLLWSLGKELGDTLQYRTHDGRELNIVPVATFVSTVFHGNILIDKSLFAQAWPENNGCNIFLVKSEDEARMKNYLAQTLYEYGIRVTPTAQRLKEFNEVTDTYLSIFMTLGGIGLLLGIFSLVIVVRKNLTRSRADIHLYLLLGYTSHSVEKILYRENIFVPWVAITTGIIGAIVGVGWQLSAVSVWVWLEAVIITLVLAGVADMFIRQEIKRCVKSIENNNLSKTL